MSLALGAFLAGVAISESDLSHQAAAEALPLRDAFAVLFFVSVGMLFDPSFIVREPLIVAFVVGLIVIRKWLLSSAIVFVLGYPIRTALIVGAGLAQIGEFSFVLSEVDRQLGVLPDEAHDLIIAAALITITLNPILFRSVEPLAKRLRNVPAIRGFDERRPVRSSISSAVRRKRFSACRGHRSRSRRFARTNALKRRNMEVLVIDQDRGIVEGFATPGPRRSTGTRDTSCPRAGAPGARDPARRRATRSHTSRSVVEFARRATRGSASWRERTLARPDYLRKAGE